MRGWWFFFFFVFLIKCSSAFSLLSSHESVTPSWFRGVSGRCSFVPNPTLTTRPLPKSPVTPRRPRGKVDRSQMDGEVDGKFLTIHRGLECFFVYKFFRDISLSTSNPIDVLIMENLDQKIILHF